MHVKPTVIDSEISSPDVASVEDVDAIAVEQRNEDRHFTKNSAGDPEKSTSDDWHATNGNIDADEDYNKDDNGNTGENHNSVGTNLRWLPSSQHGRMEASRGNDAHTKRWWYKFTAKAADDGDRETDWWFASTAVPLLAATIGPLANVLSLAALVTYWRMDLDDGHGKRLPQLSGLPFRDPRWCYWLNVVSLICGFVGNLFLLFNFTGRIRYIISLPATILLWCAATAILIGIVLGMHIYTPPVGPLQTYTQAYWHAVIAAVLYFVCSLLLIINMTGFFLGHYPERFELTDHQRTLILQTMLFFIWLAGGAAVFARLESRQNPESPQSWAFVDALYFCDVTILTIGFGDLYPSDNFGRGLVFPFSVGGIIMLGLVISSLTKFAAELGRDNIVQKHIQKERSRTVERTVTESSELTREDALRPHLSKDLKKMKISRPFDPRKGERRPGIYAPRKPRKSQSIERRSSSLIPPLAKRTTLHNLMTLRKPKLILLKEERDRFNAMRDIQRSTTRFKRWWSLSMSVIAFSILWCVGAVVFWQAEKEEQGMTYFQALYLSYISLLTIGYGDLAPKSNAGRAFFVVWSLVAVPTMTILISDMNATVIDSFKQGTFKFADFTVLPQKGVWRDFLDRHPRILQWYNDWREDHLRKRRLKRGMAFPQASDADGIAIASDDLETPGDANPPTLEALANEAEKDATRAKPLNEGRLARRLATAIRNVAADLRAEHERKYTYEEWVELTRLIRFTSVDVDVAIANEETEGMVEWDWIGENSPLMSGQSEPEFVLERLCESLSRYVRRAERRRRSLCGEKQADPSSSSGENFRLPKRNDTFDNAEGIWKRRVPKEELFGSPTSLKDGQADTSGFDTDDFGQVTTHHADKLENDGNTPARYEDEEIDPIEVSLDRNTPGR